MASDLLFCSGARTRPSWCPGQGTWDLRVMRLAPEAGASEATFVLARVPVLP